MSENILFKTKNCFGIVKGKALKELSKPIRKVDRNEKLFKGIQALKKEKGWKKVSLK